MHKATILVVGGDAASHRQVRLSIESAGYRLVISDDAAADLALLQDSRAELLLVDLATPYHNAATFIRPIRERSVLPLIVLSPAHDEDTKIKALGMGADDFLTKPYSSRELVARVDALLRRVMWSKLALPEPTIRFGDVEIDPNERRVRRNDTPVQLTATEYALLMELVNHAGRSMTHRMLLQGVWGTEYRDEAEYLRVYISRLRRKLEEDPARPRHILTEVGVGYRFERRG